MSGNRFSRQSFLGDKAQNIIGDCTIGILGLGGGGSHIVQQLAHIGVRNYVIFDADVVEESNLNRLVGATERDAKNKVPKIEVAKRMVLSLSKNSHIFAQKSMWQKNANPLKQCDIIFGCVDSFAQRQEIEIFCRRYLIPYIDIGMDVHSAEEKETIFSISGQVIVSLPGGPCMKCIGFLTYDKLAQEASLYGAAGGRPQVIWANGMLASAAVGFAIDLLTGWTKLAPQVAYLSYRGNEGFIEPHIRLDYLAKKECEHFRNEDVGDPIYKKL